MSSGVLIDFEQIYQVRGNKVSSAAKFDDLASYFKKASRDIKAEWSIFLLNNVIT
jgi:hypothetical protein